MSLLNTTSLNWSSRIQPMLPAPVRAFLGHEPGKELLQKIDYNLLFMKGELTCLETGKIREITEKYATKGPKFAEQLAISARQLIPANAKDAVVRLFLPPASFVATSVSMPGLNHDNLLSALELQVDSLLPGMESALKVTLSSQHESGSDAIALWASDSDLNLFYQALESQGLFLASIQPRILSSNHETGHAVNLDEDEDFLTLAELQNGNLTRWLSLPREDLKHEKFNAQWQEELAISTNVYEYQSAGDYASSNSPGYNSGFNFFPAGALNAKKKVEKGRRLVLAAVLAVIALGIAASPFLLQSLEVSSLERSLARERAFSNDAREDQRVVVNFENEWGALNDYPNQAIPEVMYTLEQVLRPDTLTSLEVSQGLIKIQGTSSAPQTILQRLEQDPMFTEVVFSRATNNSRYYIDLRLNTVNFEGYNVRYFPDE